MFDIYLCVFFNCYCQSLISGREAGYVSTQIMYFPNISLFPKILSFKSLGNLWGNSYTKFAILDIKFRFTCG